VKAIVSVWQRFQALSGYAVRYPPSLQPEFIADTNVLELSSSLIDGEHSGIWIYTEENPSRLTPIDWWNSQGSHQTGSEEFQTVRAGEVEALKVTMLSGFGEQHILIPHNDKIFHIVRIGISGVIFDAIVRNLTIVGQP
jgi:hypothetical protein